MKLKIAFVFAFILVSFFSEAYQIIEMNLWAIIQNSEIAFRGKCESSKVMKIYPSGNSQGLEVTNYVFSVTECMKGECGSKFEFNQYGVSKSEAKELRAPHAVGFTEFEAGKEYVVFLTSKTNIGVRAPTGMQGGVFNVTYASDGSAKVVNGFANSNLFKGLPKTKSVTKALKAVNIDESAPPSGPLSYGDLKKMVDVLK